MQEIQIENKKILQLVLVGISSFLLGIWAVKEVIALRHVLLGLGLIGSILYVYEQRSFVKKFSINSYIPIVIIGLIFTWVALHYLFITQHLDQQLKELSSTWSRSFIATLIGVTTGHALGDMLKNNKLNQYKLIFIGMTIAIIIYVFQYIANIVEYKKIFIPIYDEYIFRGKLNQVLTSSVLIALVLGISKLQNSKNYNLWTVALLILTVYSYVNISNSKIGLLMIFILIIFNFRYSFIKRKLSIIFLLLGIVSLAYIQSSHNHGWATFLEDFQGGWYSSPEKAIFNNGVAPVLESGHIADSSTYQRAFLFHFGLKSASQNPLGIGVINEPLKLLIRSELNNGPFGTHSGFLDLTIAFGLPFIFLIGCLLLFLTYGFYITKCKNIKMPASNIIIVIVFLYSVGELSNSHAVEILMYLLGVLSGLYIIGCPKNIIKDN